MKAPPSSLRFSSGSSHPACAPPIPRPRHASAQDERHGPHLRLREFGTWHQAGVSAYSEGRAGFVPPKDWVVGGPPAIPRDSVAPNPGKKKKQPSPN